MITSLLKLFWPQWSWSEISIMSLPEFSLHYYSDRSFGLWSSHVVLAWCSSYPEPRCDIRSVQKAVSEQHRTPKKSFSQLSQCPGLICKCWWTCCHSAPSLSGVYHGAVTLNHSHLSGLFSPTLRMLTQPFLFSERLNHSAPCHLSRLCLRCWCYSNERLRRVQV